MAIYYNLSKAVTIMVRYSLYRKQFKDNKGSQMSILDYQLQQEKIFPRIAQTYANFFAVKTIKRVAEDVLKQAHQGKYSGLNQAHITTSAVKAIFSKDVIQGMQILRRSGGGHAFNSYSGIPVLQN